MTIPDVMTRSATISQAICAGPPRKATPSYRTPSPIEMRGSAVVTMAWTGARNLPCWKAFGADFHFPERTVLRRTAPVTGDGVDGGVGGGHVAGVGAQGGQDGQAGEDQHGEE